MNSYPLLAKLVAVVSALISLVGLVLMSFGLYLAYFSFSTALWPTTEAQIVESRVVRTSSQNATHYRPVIKYRYVVNGVEYNGDSIRFINFGYDDEKEARQVVERFPVGQKVELRFQSSNPKMSVLDAGLHQSDWLPASAGMALIAVAFILRFVRRKWLMPQTS